MKPKTLHFLCFGILLPLVLASCSFSESLRERHLAAKYSRPEAPLLAEVLMHLQLDYVESEKLDPEKLLQGALSELGRMIPEVGVVSRLQEKGLGLSLKIRIENENLVLPVSELHGLYDLQLVLQNLMKRLLQMKPQLTQLKIEQMFARGILNQLDAYSVLLPQEIYNEFNINIGGQFAGVGLVVGTHDDQLTVIAPMDGSPAALAGIQPLDRIVAVDGEITEHMTLDEILYRLRGEIGTTVTLSVLRKGQAKALEFELLREEIKVESVGTFDLESGNQTVRYVRIKNFQTDTFQELINKLGALNKIHGLILDLRNNPGGLLEQAIRVSDLFLPGKQRIVSTKGTTVSSIHDAKHLFAAEHLLNIPLVLLINRGSASASEIVAAALKQNKRAVVIGVQSFGKGTVQTLWDLKDGSGLKLTIGEYLTPSGRSIQDVGVMPNLQLIPLSVPKLVSQVSEAGSQEQSTAQKRFGLLPELDAEKTVKDSGELRIRYLLQHTNLHDDSEIIDKNVIKEKLKADIFIKTAKLVLSKWNPQNINSVVQKISREVDQKESEIIKQALAKHGIEWSLNPFLKSVPAEMLDLSWSTEAISAELIRLKVQLKNVGDIDAQRLIVVIRANNELLDGLEFPIGKLVPEELGSRILDVKILPGMMEEIEPVELQLYDHNLKKLKSVHEQLHFSPKRRPSFQLVMKMLDNGELGSHGNADGKVQSGETIALRFKIANTGEKPVPELLLKIRGTEGSFKINRGKIVLKNLLPDNEQKDFLLFQTLTGVKKLGKISLEMLDTKSGTPKITHLWDLKNLLPEKPVVTPEFTGLKWQDFDGNSVEGETALQSLVLSGKVKNAADMRDVFVHLNDEKVFYSANYDTRDGTKNQLGNNSKYPFKTVLNLEPGKNQISVFSRNRYGFTSERKIRIFRRQ